MNFIGREKELYELRLMLQQKGRRFVSIIGRRGSGKTALKTQFLTQIQNDENYLILDFRAIKNKKRKEHIEDCLIRLNNQLRLSLNIKDLYREDENVLNYWSAFFDFLYQKIIERLNGKKLIFVIDEFAWFQTKQSSFAEHFAVFYDRFQGVDSLFLITASAVSWMNKNVLKTSGGLHSKVHFVIKLKPFDLLETIQFLHKINPNFSNYEYMQYYLYTGGVVRYLEKIQPQKSILENVKALFINNGNEKGDEFLEVFNSAFEGKSDIHLDIVNAFKNKNCFTKKELGSFLKKYSNVSISNAVDDLVVSDILSEKQNYGKEKRDKIYCISDLFCFYCIKVFNNNIIDQILLEKSYTFNGYAFEIFCLLNSQLIKKQILRAGFDSRNYSWHNDNAQIDLIFDYGSKRFSIIECKNYNSDYTFNHDDVSNLINKKQEFSFYLKSKSQRNFEIDFVIVSMFKIKINDGRIFPLFVSIDEVIENHKRLLN